ncbi:ABC transporter ATP-binding protein [Arcobacter sp.]|uniref:ABC transporter ATP-binding protein n=1 Tax=Arcobacter sp. TaxID=1872629 RepID=UPI003D0CD650
MADLVLKNIVKKYSQGSSVNTIDNIDLSIKSGEFIVFVGPSGCGKSTLLRMIAGLESVTSGTISIDGKDLTYANPSDRNVSMVFQSYALYPHMTVFENIAFGLKLSKEDKSTIEEKVNKVAEILKLDILLDRLPKELSGGQRQRVAIGRSMVRNPKVFLFDEPLSNLDAALRIKTRLEIAQMHQNIDSTMVYVTHDQVEAMTLADRLVILNKGKVQQFATPKDAYDNPKNKFVAGFIGSPAMNFIDVVIQKDYENNQYYISLNNSHGKSNDIYLENHYENIEKYLGKTVTAGIRPEHMQNGFRDSQISNELQSLETVVDYYEYVGADGFLFFDLNNTTVLSRISPSGFKGINNVIELKVWAKKILFFDKDTEERIY